MVAMNSTSGDFVDLKSKFSGIKRAVFVIFGLLFFLVFILPLISFVNPLFSVEFGTVGVVSRFGKVNNLASPGLNFKVPFADKVFFYNTQKVIYETNETPELSPFYNKVSNTILRSSESQKRASDSSDVPVDTTTKDGQQVSIRFSLRYSLDPSKILWIAQNVGTQDQVATRVVQAESRSYARNIAREFPAQELYAGDVFSYQQKVGSALKESFSKNGVILDEFLVRQVKFGEAYMQAVEQKQIEQEKVKTEEFKAQQEEFIKKQRIIRAEGEAKAQEILKFTIDPLILEKMAIEKWNGVLPTYMGSSAVPFINIK
jgi:regulator of protease activity HflC (stomatin/prohibitin superfamily)